MTTPPPVFDLSPLSEPIVKLIETVADAIGVVYEPTRVVRKAKADAAAAIILAKSQIEVDELERQAAQRIIDREVKRQQNRVKVTQKAMEALPSDVSDVAVDEDWVHDFYDHVEDISNEQLQELWARILAGEVTQPGSFSRRTLNAIRFMSPLEARLFANLCSLVWTSGPVVVPLVLDTKAAVYHKLGLSLEALFALSAAGLVNTPSFVSHVVTCRDDPKVDMYYFGHTYRLTLPKLPMDLELGKLMFSDAGRELLQVVRVGPNEEFLDYVLGYWRVHGIGVEEL